MRLWWCFRPIVTGANEASPGKSLHGSVPEEADVRAVPSAMSSCKRIPQFQAHQALPPCLQQLPLQHTLQGPQQLALPQQTQTVQPNDCKLLNDQYFISFNELVFHQVIGQGSFKSVFRGRWRNTNVAIVRMLQGGLLTEARLMQKLSTHPNLVQFYRWSQDAQGNEYLVLELVPLGSLSKVLLRFGEVLRMRAKLSVAEQVAAAMAELHKEGVLHRDLAARNVLVQSLDPVHVKVADFGLAHLSNCQDPDCNHPSDDSSFSSCSSSVLQLDSIPVRWCSPEVISHQAWGPASDVWAFGVTLWEIFADGAEPYAMHNDAKVVEVVLSGGRLPRPARCPREVYGLMMQCWATTPDNRPTFNNILTTFSQWRQEHAHQSQAAQQLLTLAHVASTEVPCSLALGANPLRHAQSWTPQQAADTPYCSTGSDCSADKAAPGSQPPTAAPPGDGVLKLVHTASVYRSLSEPLPSWDLNQQAKVVLQPTNMNPGHNQQLDHNYSRLQSLCTGICCRSALLSASCSNRHSGSSSSSIDGYSPVPQRVGRPYIEDTATTPAGAAEASSAVVGLGSSSDGNIQGCHSSSVLVSCSGLDKACFHTYSNKLSVCSPAAHATGGDEQRQGLQEGQCSGQQLSYACPSQPPGTGACLSQTSGVWLPWYGDAVGDAEVPLGVANAVDRVRSSVEMSFDLEGMIDPNDSTFHEPEELASMSGSWDPLVAAARTWSSCSSRSSSNTGALTRRHIQFGYQPTALYGNARELAQVIDDQYVGSSHKAQADAANLRGMSLGDAAEVEVINGSAAAVWYGVPRRGAYVEVRSVVYGGQEIAS